MDIIFTLFFVHAAVVAHVIFILRNESSPLMRAVSLVCLMVLGYYVFQTLPDTHVLTPLEWTGQASIGWPVAIAIGFAFAFAMGMGRDDDAVRSRTR